MALQRRASAHNDKSEHVYSNKVALMDCPFEESLFMSTLNQCKEYNNLCLCLILLEIDGSSVFFS